MAMKLNIASKANQATTFPALLVASYLKETDKNSAWNIEFEEVESFKTDDTASVELTVDNSAPVHGSENAIYKLIETFSFLRGKNKSLVCATEVIMFIIINIVLRSMSGSKRTENSLLQTSSLPRHLY